MVLCSHVYFVIVITLAHVYFVTVITLVSYGNFHFIGKIWSLVKTNQTFSNYGSMYITCPSLQIFRYNYSSCT